jgi:hypothetical protein
VLRVGPVGAGPVGLAVWLTSRPDRIDESCLCYFGSTMWASRPQHDVLEAPMLYSFLATVNGVVPIEMALVVGTMLFALSWVRPRRITPSLHDGSRGRSSS